MKKSYLVLFALILTLSLVGCKRGNKDNNNNDGYDYDSIPDNKESSNGKYQIAFVTDVGVLKDKSFNQGTWEGVKRYAFENDKSYKYYQPANGNNATDDDRYDAMKAAAEGGAEIIICSGYMHEPSLQRATVDYPNVKYVFVDGWALGKENVTAIVYKEEESGYLAGYAAVMDGYTKLGYSGGGGGTNPACQRFGYGYIQGANDAAKEKGIIVKMKYSWLYGSSFSASADLQAMLNGWYSTGTEVIFVAGGAMCQSAFAAASANDGKVIGVDVDQSKDSPTVITSATKGLREGTMYALDMFYTDKWVNISDKTVSLGAKDDAIGLPTSTWSLENFTIEEYNDLYEKIKDGTIDIDDVVAGHEDKTYSNVDLDYIK